MSSDPSSTSGTSDRPHLLGVLAPVVLFAYMRPDHLQQTVESLQGNREARDTDLYVFCDGARQESHERGVAAVRSYVDSLTGFRSVNRVYRPENLGLARSVIDGVTHVMHRRGRAIVLEDDLVLSPHFLRFMNEALDRYADDPRVASVHGYCVPAKEPLPETFFLEGADCWGWATWSRAWEHFRSDGAQLLAELQQRKLEYHFDLDASFPYTAMLKDQVAGRNDSWAIRWHASCYLRGLLTLHPGRSLVENIGNDSSGTHSRATDIYTQAVSPTPVEVRPVAVAASEEARRAIARFHRSHRSLPARLRSLAARLGRRR